MRDEIDFGRGTIIHDTLSFVDRDASLPELFLGEDLLLVMYLQGKFYLDVGWYGSGEGCFIVRVVSGKREEPFQKNAESWRKLKKVIEEGVAFIHSLMEMPDDVPCYRSQLPPDSISSNNVDQLLGVVEIEWEDKQSDVALDPLKKLEKVWGVQLPEDLKEIILSCNGGGPLPYQFPLDEERWGEFLRLMDFSAKIELDEKLPAGLYPFGNSDRGLLCLDYRVNAGEPAIVIVDLEEEDESEQVIHLADHFRVFLRSLSNLMGWRRDTTAELRERIAQQLFKLEKEWEITFPTPYKKLVLEHEGGTPEAPYIYTNRARAEVSHLLQLIDLDAEDSVRRIYQEHFADTKHFPFAMCTNGDILCHSYQGEEVTVVLWSQAEDAFHPVNSSFARFLQYLRYQ
ncbi:SMI1-KNR4 cell-wall [Marininema mesophilum]|uniref:SMI1-KNR4 cell-wall n=1 Tax=Marininema mesophilum TaxID=1048340 RepID=A0A1H2WC39_9BACL|nr:SMI1/KNR4 family protein [Marininema mesophilum]SDW78107.1 SMI1-KNR4 cell-wall [Marininema mesophilum]